MDNYNTEINNYKVYEHTFPNNKKYFGITSQKPKNRWLNGRGYLSNKNMYRAIKKYGWENIEHKIIYEGLNKEEAENIEIQLILKYDTVNPRKGYNLEYGGNAPGRVSQRTKQILSQMRMGENNPMYGITGKNHHNSKEINQYDLDGRFLKKWDCGAFIEEVGISTKSKVIACCKGRRKSANGYQWRYYKGSKDDIEPYQNYIIDISGENNPNYGKKGKDNPVSKKVNQYDKFGKFIKTYNSIQEGGRETNVSFKSISSCCRGVNKSAGGFMWKYFDGDINDIKPYKNNIKVGEESPLYGKTPKNIKKVSQYDLKGNFIQQFNSIKEASEKTGTNYTNIGMCCKGKRKNQ